MKAKKVNEGIEDLFGDKGNTKAIAGWTKAFIARDEEEHILEILEPITVKISAEDKASFKFLFNKYRIPYKITSVEDKEIRASKN